MPPETLLVPRAPFDIEDPWAMPQACAPARLRRATDAAVPRLTTLVVAYFDDAYLTVLFSAADDHVEATHLEHDAPLYEEDVVEVFLAPEAGTRYYELEVSPRGTMFDARIDSPDGRRATMQVDRAWTCDGLFAAIRTTIESDGTTSVDTLLRIPFAALDAHVPNDGDTWRANFYRIDRHPRFGDEFSAWQPTWKVPADFHVPAAFGSLRFAG